MQPNADFSRQRAAVLAELSLDAIDAPMVTIVGKLAACAHCFPLQSCYGHFVSAQQPDRQNLSALPTIDPGVPITYRIAYLALCLENSVSGKELLAGLKTLQKIDADYVQVGSAQWFWKQHINSYVMQIEPERHKEKDKVVVQWQEAVHIEGVRNRVWQALENLLC